MFDLEDCEIVGAFLFYVNMENDKKICKACLLEKLKIDFYKNKAYEDGLDYRCKKCFLDKVKAKQNYILVGINKTCKKCKEHKDMSNFIKRKNSKDGYANSCKRCRNIKLPDYSHIESKICPKCDTLKHFKEFHKNNRSPTGVASHCKDCKRIRSKEYGKKEDVKKMKKENLKKWVQNNPQKNRDTINRWRRERRKSDNIYRLEKNIRGILKNKFKKLKLDTDKTNLELLKITTEEFKKHIESQFESWMTWDNYGNACEVLEPNCSWDLDHIVPISLAKTEEDIYLLNHWSNFQPLCSFKNRNIKRGNIYPVTNLETKKTYIDATKNI